MKKIVLRAKIGVGILVFGVLGLVVWPVQTASKEGVSAQNTAIPHEPAHMDSEDGFEGHDAQKDAPATRVRMATHAITPNPAVQAMMDQVTTSTLRSLLGDLSGEWPVIIQGASYTITTRNSFSYEPNEKAIQYGYEKLQSAGLQVGYQPWAAWDYSNNGVLRLASRNIIGEITGKTNPQDIYLITSHLDDMPSYGLASGADDNASGSAAVILAAQIMNQYSWNCTFKYILWTGEEQGLYGSQWYADDLWAKREGIKGMINMDMIGWNAGPPNSIGVHANDEITESMTLAGILGEVASSYNLNITPNTIVYTEDGYFSDHFYFWQHFYPVITMSEERAKFNPRYHTSQDNLQYLDLEYYANTVRAVIGTLAHSSGCLASQAPNPTSTPTSTSTPLPNGFPTPTLTATPTPFGVPYPSYRIRGHTWDDSNYQDGMVGNVYVNPYVYEPSLPGINVALLNESGQILSQTISGPAGYYSFIGLTGGTYVVSFTAPSGYTFTIRSRPSYANPLTGATDPFVLNGYKSDIYAGFVIAPNQIQSPTPTIPAPPTQTRTPTITPTPTQTLIPTPTNLPNHYNLGNFVWVDGNLNGVQDEKIGIAGILISLLDINNAVISTTLTNASGYYTFTNLPAATYVVSFTCPKGCVFTTRDAFGNQADSLDSDVYPNGRTDPLALNFDNYTIDAGVIKMPHQFFFPNTTKDGSETW